MIIHVCAIVDFHLCSNNIAYIYSAAGEKLAKKMKDNTYQYYSGSMVYDNAKALNYILFDEGKVNKVSGAYSYEYHLKDLPIAIHNHVRTRDYFHRPEETSDEEIMDEYGGTPETKTDATGKPIYKQTVDEENLRQYEGIDGTKIAVSPSRNPTSNGKISSIDSLINNPASTVDTVFKHTTTGNNMKYSKSNFPFVNEKHGSAHGWRIPK